MDDLETAIPSATGRCLCGAVRIELAEVRPQVEVCHCTMCRQWGGAPFMGVSAASFGITGQHKVTAHRSSGWAERAFCQVCGSNLYYRFLPADHYSFCAGLFNFGDAVSMTKQIFVDEKPVFYDFAQDTPMQTAKEVIAEAAAAGFSFPEQADEK